MFPPNLLTKGGCSEGLGPFYADNSRAKEEKNIKEVRNRRLRGASGFFSAGRASSLEPAAGGFEMERLFLFTPLRRKVEQDLRAIEPEGIRKHLDLRGVRVDPLCSPRPRAIRKHLDLRGVELTRFARNRLELKIF